MISDIFFSEGNMMGLTEKQGFTGKFKKNTRLPSSYREVNVGQMKYLTCAATCLKMNNCHFFRHGNETAKTQSSANNSVKTSRHSQQPTYLRWRLPQPKNSALYNTL